MISQHEGGRTHERILEKLVGFYFVERCFEEAFLPELIVRVVVF